MPAPAPGFLQLSDEAVQEEKEEGFLSDHEQEEGGEEGEGEEVDEGEVGRDGDEGEEDEGEPEADADDETVLAQLREQAQPIEPRTRLAKGRGFLCWNTKDREGFFPLILTEDWSKGMQKMRCACLEPRGGGIYTVDPHWKGDSTKLQGS